MNTLTLQTQIATLMAEVMEESKKLPYDKQYNTEYAMQHLGAVLADLRRIEAWNIAIQKWAESSMMTSSCPRLKDFYT